MGVGFGGCGCGEEEGEVSSVFRLWRFVEGSFWLICCYSQIEAAPTGELAPLDPGDCQTPDVKVLLMAMVISSPRDDSTC